MSEDSHRKSGQHPAATVRPASTKADWATIRRLFAEYRTWLADHRDPDPSAGPRVTAGLALVDDLIAHLPGAYGPPSGDVLLWFEGNDVVACGAIRELEPKVGEVKRVYVRADYRGPVFGPKYVRAVQQRARELGYETLKVDTLASMAAAIEFYQETGFRPTSAFWPHPAAGTLFFECALGTAKGRR